MERRGELGNDARIACQLAAHFELLTGHTDRCLRDLDEAAKFPGPDYGKDDAEKEAPVFAAYHVAVYPTNFLISSAGKILWRGTGFGASSLRELEAALADAGIK